MNFVWMISRWSGIVVGIAVGLGAETPAQAQSIAPIVADSPYANSDGPTIYKGQTYYPYGSNNDYGGFGEGLPIFRFGRSGARLGGGNGARTGNLPVGPAVASQPARAVVPYLTNQTYEPGDGYRYPLYYNPATAGYFYYPVRR